MDVSFCAVWKSMRHNLLDRCLINLKNQFIYIIYICNLSSSYLCSFLQEINVCTLFLYTRFCFYIILACIHRNFWRLVPWYTSSSETTKEDKAMSPRGWNWLVCLENLCALHSITWFLSGERNAGMCLCDCAHAVYVDRAHMLTCKHIHTGMHSNHKGHAVSWVGCGDIPPSAGSQRVGGKSSIQKGVSLTYEKWDTRVCRHHCLLQANTEH